MTFATLDELHDRIVSLQARLVATDERVTKALGETHTPPESVRSAAARGLELRAKYKRGGLSTEQASEQGIGSGVQRAVNLKNGNAITHSTILRMRGFFARHAKNYAPDKTESDGGPTAGTIAWLLWGGNAGKAWADAILARTEKVRKDHEATGPSASDVHVPGPLGGSTRRREDLEKEADDRKTPAPKKDRIVGSDKNPRGSAADGGGGIDLSGAVESTLSAKVAEHNEKHPEAGKRATLGSLKAVYRRGAGAYSGSHRPGVSRGAWAMARVNAYLRLLRSGRPENPAYTQDNGLLPAAHPRSTKGKS